jgi:hypothetical protein
MTHHDPLTELRDQDPARRTRLDLVPDDAFTSIRDRIPALVTVGDTVGAAQGLAPARRFARPGAAVIAGIAVAAVTTAGAAGIALWPRAQLAGAPGSVICIDSWADAANDTPGPRLTVDPVADCIAYRAAADLPPIPDAVAFDYHGILYVSPAAEMPAEGTVWVAPADDDAIRELDASLHDWVDGGARTCQSPEDAAAFAGAEVDRLGLGGWTVTTDPAPAEPEEGFRCADAVVEPETRTVRVLPLRDPGPPSEPSELSAIADTLRTQVAERCVSLADAEAVVRDALADVHHWPVAVVTDDDAACTRVDLTAGGSILVTLHGR